MLSTVSEISVNTGKLIKQLLFLEPCGQAEIYLILEEFLSKWS